MYASAKSKPPLMLVDIILDAENGSEGAAKMTENTRMGLGVLVCLRICQTTVLGKAHFDKWGVA